MLIRFLSLLSLALSVPPLFSQTNTAPEAKKTNIGVMDLRAEGDLKSAAGILSDRLRAEFFNTGKFSVMERGEMDAILKEQGFQQSGACDDKACMVQVGQLLGVEKMAAGSIGILGTVYLINLRIIDVATGKLIDTYSGECRCPIEDLGNAMGTAATALAGDAPPAVPEAAPPGERPLKRERSLPMDHPRWRLGVSGGNANADPELNQVWDLYLNPPWNARYKLISDKAGDLKMDNFGKLLITVSRSFRPKLWIRASWGVLQNSADAKFEFGKVLQDAHSDFDGDLDVSVNMTNHYFGLGLETEKRFRRVRASLGVDFALLASSYDLTLDGRFRGYDYDLGADVERPLSGNLRLAHTAPSFDVHGGLEWMLGKHLGLGAELSFTRSVHSAMEGAGNLSDIEKALMEGWKQEGNAKYVLASVEKADGERIVFFKRKDASLDASAFKDIFDQSVNFSHGSGRVMANFYF